MDGFELNSFFYYCRAKLDSAADKKYGKLCTFFTFAEAALFILSVVFFSIYIVIIL